MIILAIQHLFGMFGATVLVPILANQAAGAEVWSIGVVFTMSGVGTLIYHLCTRGKSPVYLGSSFAFIAPMVSVYLAAGVGMNNAQGFLRVYYTRTSPRRRLAFALWLYRD